MRITDEKLRNALDERVLSHIEGGWISVKDQLPPEGEAVLCYCKGRHSDDYPYIIQCDWRQHGVGKEWRDDCEGAMHNVIHWMPLPEPPEGAAEG